MNNHQNPQEESLLIGIGDLHGHFPALQCLLEELEEKYAIFSNAPYFELRQGVELVFTGDYIDRGRQNLTVIETLMRLQEENPTQVHELFGNHELLALAGLGRARDLLTTQPRDDDLLSAYYRCTVHGRNGGLAFLEEFGSTPRTALEDYVQRMARGGDIGSWMRKLQPLYLAQMQDKNILFVHGGIPTSLENPQSLKHYVKDFEEHVATDSVQFGSASQKFLKHRLVDGHSIFWDRQLNSLNREEVEELVRNVGVDYVVIGHTPQEGVTCFGDHIFNIDVGMCPTYGEGEPAAILFKKDGVHAFYARRGEQRLVTY
ncbi:serine/threonine protein phosphatase [Candidatus Woesearchaeota archaeon]|nr:serine/threonine protein phosphatase [Candidatus Woesearchaeota archaeon]